MYGTLVSAATSLGERLLPIGLGRALRITRPVAARSLLSHDDVEEIPRTATLELR